MDPLTLRQRRCLEAVLAHRRRTGLPPTYRELGRALGIASTNGVRRHLEALERKGYLRMRPTARGLELSEEIAGAAGIPILGRIAAGRPVEALENFEGAVDMGSLYGTYPEVFAVRVVGDSMMGAGIRDGDLAIVRAAPKVENGAVAAVAIDGEATVKRFYAERGAVTLVAANPRYAPRIIREDEGREVRVLGRVVGLVRRMGS
ncbi:MAG TPA: transcriptional repressor LexA [Planctomycetota bacterium]|jgi:repressor LexA|nr:transcriptional repressor LexA [Planctomycetota bacterium]